MNYRYVYPATAAVCSDKGQAILRACLIIQTNQKRKKKKKRWVEWRKKLRINSYACFGSKVASYIAKDKCRANQQQEKKKKKRKEDEANI